MLQITATRSANEADELHSKLITVQQRVQKLEEENQLISSLHDRKPERRPSDSYNKQTADTMISKLEHENKVIIPLYILIISLRNSCFLRRIRH